MANLINNGILPLTFKNEKNYDLIDRDDKLELSDIAETIKNGGDIVIKDVTKGIEIPVDIALSDRQRSIILAGGLLNYTRLSAEKE